MPQLRPSRVASALPSGQNRSSHQPSPSTFVIIASTTTVLQLELIMSINCPKGQLQRRPSTLVVPQGQLVQTSTTSPAWHCSCKTEILGLYCCYPLGWHKPINYSEVKEKYLLFSSEDKLFNSTGLLPVDPPVSKLCAALQSKLEMRDT